jgi:hypothetical protein
MSATSREEIRFTIKTLDPEQTEFILTLQELHEELEAVGQCSWRKVLNLILFIPGVLLSLFRYELYSPIWGRQEILRKDMERVRTFYKEKLGWARFNEAENILTNWRRHRHIASAKPPQPTSS